MRAVSLLLATLSVAGLSSAQQGGAVPPAGASAPAAQDPAAQDPAAKLPATPKEPAAAPQEPAPTAKQSLAKFHPQEGTVAIGTMAEAKLGAGWLWLGGEDGRKFLRQIGNQPGPSTLGVAIPPDFADSEVFAVYSYADDGHVDDDEAPDYDQLLTDMKESAVEQSKERQKAGLGTVALLGWAEPPHYEKAQHKLYWAEKLQFSESDGLVLNYNVRVLGRSGHLVVNGVGGIEQLGLVAQHSKELLQVTEFKDGQRYEQFDANYDKVATYGLGGLIAGGVAAKAGLFAKLAVLLKVAIKPILIGLAVLGGAIAKVFGGRKARVKKAPEA